MTNSAGVREPPAFFVPMRGHSRAHSQHRFHELQFSKMISEFNLIRGCTEGEHVLLASVAREQYKEKCYSAYHMDASTLHSDEGRSQLR